MKVGRMGRRHTVSLYRCPDQEDGCVIRIGEPFPFISSPWKRRDVMEREAVELARVLLTYVPADVLNGAMGLMDRTMANLDSDTRLGVIR